MRSWHSLSIHVSKGRAVLQKKKQNFVEGAFILLLANLIVKVIGALFQVPLKNLIGSNDFPAFGLFSMAYRIYTAILIVSTVGLPAALSKMVAEATALGKEREVKRIVKVAACVFLPIGTLGTLVLLFLSSTLANMIGNPDAKLAVMMIAPSVLMVAILSVFRGYYQGRSNMVPTAISQIIEAFGKLFVGLGFAYITMSRGYAAAVVAASAILGVTVGEAAAALYMLAQSTMEKLRRGTIRAGMNDTVRPKGAICKTLLSLSIPITISSAVMSVTDLIDVALVSNRLQFIGMTQDQATAIYGVYTGMAVNFFNLPQTLITALAVSVLPAVAAARIAKNTAKVTQTVDTTFRLTMLISLPAGAGFLLLSQPILRLVYSSDTILGGRLMQILGLAVPFVAIVAITNAMLQALGRVDIPIVSMFLGALAKLFCAYTLLGNPNMQILGAPISTVVCYAIIALVNMVQIARLVHKMPAFGKTFGKPLAATIGMGAATYICFHTLSRLLETTAGSSLDKVVTLLSILVAVAVYGGLLLALHAVEKEDVLMLPKGEKIAKLLRL